MEKGIERKKRNYEWRRERTRIWRGRTNKKKKVRTEGLREKYERETMQGEEWDDGHARYHK